jgi:hypothetical protein
MGAAPDRGANLDEEGGIDKDISGAIKETGVGALKSCRAIEGTRIFEISQMSLDNFCIPLEDCVPMGLCNLNARVYAQDGSMTQGGSSDTTHLHHKCGSV